MSEPTYYLSDSHQIIRRQDGVNVTPTTQVGLNMLGHLIASEHEQMGVRELVDGMYLARWLLVHFDMKLKTRAK